MESNLKSGAVAFGAVSAVLGTIAAGNQFTDANAASIGLDLGIGVVSGSAVNPLKNFGSWCARKAVKGELPLEDALIDAIGDAYIRAIDGIEQRWKGKKFGSDESEHLFNELRKQSAGIKSNSELGDVVYADITNPTPIELSISAAEYIKGILSPVLGTWHGDMRLRAFIEESMPGELAGAFVTELKRHDAAFREFQILVLTSEIESLSEIQSGVHDNTETLARLEAMIQEIRNDSTRHHYLSDQLDLAFAALSTQLQEVEQRVLDRIDESDNRVIGSIETVKDEVVALRVDFREWQAGTSGERSIGKIFGVPLGQNRWFHGRDDVLEEIERSFIRSNNRSVIVQVIHAQAGFGKTQAASEYAHRHKSEYAGIWWADSSTALEVQTSMATLASELDLPASKLNDPIIAAIAARNHLETALSDGEKWLLVFDHAESPKAIREFVPRTGNVDVLVTSHVRGWPGEYLESPLPPLGAKDGVEFLCRRTGDQDRASAAEIVKILDGLPLALEQVGAWVVAKSGWRSLREFLNQYEARLSVPLGDTKPNTGDYDRTFLETWAISFAAVKDESQEAADLLNLLAFFAPDGIPFDLIVEHANEDSASLDRSLEILHKYSFVSLMEPGSISVHRLHQTVAKDQLDLSSRQARASRVVNLLNDSFPDPENVDQWNLAGRLLPHAIAITDECESNNVVLAATASVLTKIGAFARARGQGQLELRAFERSLRMRERLYVDDHPDLALSLNEYGRALEALASFSQAEEHHRRALDMRRRLFSSDHEVIAHSLSNLAINAHSQGDSRTARPLAEEALAMLRRLFPGDHPDVASGRGILALVVQDQGDLPAARRLNEEALAMDRRLFPGDHPSVATSLGNLASVVRAQRDLPTARRLNEEALEMRRRLFPSDHPDVATSLGNLAVIAHAQGKLVESRRFLHEALRIRKNLLPPLHPDIARTLRNLATVERASGFPKQAREFAKRADEIENALRNRDS
jgi:tetratricopeptide (TPR) repeat protein